MELTVRGLPIHYEEAGSGRPLVVLHGWPADHRLPSHHLEPIFAERKGWRRIYPDLPGMGQTPGADWINCQDDMLEIVLEFLEIVAPGQRMAVGGVSYGGYLALAVARHRAARLAGLMLWTPMMHAFRRDTRLPAFQVLIDDPHVVADVGPDEQLWLRMAVVRSPETLRAFRESVKPGIMAADHAFIARIEQRYALSVDPVPLLEPFAGPSLVVTGRQDSACGYADALDLDDQLPRATFAVLDRAGHGVAEEQRVLFRALVADWLDRMEAEPA